MKIGYCPTMAFFIDEIAKKIEFEKINLGSAQSVLTALNNNYIDIGIIGRTAKKTEFNGFKKRIKNGYTLVTNKKQMILNNDLPHLKINTNISENIVKTNFPYLKNVIFHKTINFNLKDYEIWLISWDDWKDEYELLIPVDEQYNKNSDFRVPHLFSKNEKNLAEIIKLINNTQ